MAVSITRLQIDEGRDVAPTPVKKTVPVTTTPTPVKKAVPITTTPITGALGGRVTTSTKSGGAATTPVNTGATITPVGSGTVATATRTSPTTVVTGSSSTKQTGIGSGVQPGTVMSVGFGAEAAVYSVARNDISAKNVLYANARKEEDTPAATRLAGYIINEALPIVGALDFGAKAFIDAIHGDYTLSEIFWKTIQGAVGGYQYGRGTQIFVEAYGNRVNRESLDISPSDIIAAAAIAWHEGSHFNVTTSNPAGYADGFGQAFDQMAMWIAFNYLGRPRYTPEATLQQNWGGTRSMMLGNASSLTDEQIFIWHEGMLQNHPDYAEVYAQATQVATLFSQGYPDPTGGATAMITMATTPMSQSGESGYETTLSSILDAIMQHPIDISLSPYQPTQGPNIIMVSSFLRIEETERFTPSLAAWKYRVWQ